jgi:hypothetical protein
MVEGLPDVLAAVNARIREVAERSAERSSEWEFMCECGRPGCDERVKLSLRDYEALLTNRMPVLAPRHVQDQKARARGLRQDAKAVLAQAEHQLARTKKNTPSGT